jgi:hypothetical protein
MLPFRWEPSPEISYRARTGSVVERRQNEFQSSAWGQKGEMMACVPLMVVRLVLLMVSIELTEPDAERLAIMSFRCCANLKALETEAVINAAATVAKPRNAADSR